MKRTTPYRARRRRGAAMVEFMIAIVPVLMIWTVCWQLSRVYTGRLMLKHAATIGVRAAAVTHDNQNLPKPKNAKDDQEDGQKAVENAVGKALGPWQNTAIRNVEVTIDDSSNRDEYDGPFGLVTVKVKATFKCDVPMAKYMVCGGGASIDWEETANYPHQGARYKTED